MQEDFISQATSIIEENLGDEQFGVSELAGAMNMSRSNLLRKVKKHTNLSASQFIRQVRLEIAMDLLKEESFTVSEVSYKVGFGSNSYFIKCFREYYGYPPGEVGKSKVASSDSVASSASQRRLVAIMFTDIQGYTSLMQSDEKKGVAYRERHREVFNSITKKYNGRILQYYGDGTLSTFTSAIDAVQCGIEMQLAFKEEPKVPIRIGVHTGDIIATDEEIIGDGVNVAARIESMSKPGTVYISDKVYDEVKNQPDLITNSLGVHKLKNVSKPMEVYAVSNYQLGGFETSDANRSGRNQNLKWYAAIAAIIVLGIFGYFSEMFSRTTNFDLDSELIEKSIAVLPFKNESSDSGNVYFINGLMESTLNNLQKIEDLRVISRTSVEKYRNSSKAIPEIAYELGVNYFVEGSGQKVGDQVLLNIQLIEASSDKHIWAEQYTREIGDIFSLQNEVAMKIANAIEAIVTPSELEQIEKKPTENLEAYDLYLQSREPLFTRSTEGLEKAISLLNQAIDYDPEFSSAYADIAISYYFLDLYQAEKRYTEEINTYADKAMLYDSKSDISLLAKALYYMHTEEYRLALPHLEKALEYNPNSFAVLQTLSEFYAGVIPNTAKYLEYALMSLQINSAGIDSTSKSYQYLSLSNAFVQSGFVDEALVYINKSLEHDPNNYYAPYVKAYVLYARDKDIKQTKNILLREWNKDTTRLDILQEVAKLYYYEENYDSAFFYYEKFTTAREAGGLDMYPQEDIKIGVTYEKVGRDDEAAKYFESYAAYCERDQSIYKAASTAVKYAYEGEYDQAIDQLQIFATQENFQYWILLFMDKDPIMKPLSTHPEFDEVMQKIEDQFWKNHNELRKSLEEKGLI
ncbi:MAG: helix-turn-helix domain-containing protein [Balneolaceae bacterium]